MIYGEVLRVSCMVLLKWDFYENKSNSWMIWLWNWQRIVLEFCMFREEFNSDSDYCNTCDRQIKIATSIVIS